MFVTGIAGLIATIGLGYALHRHWAEWDGRKRIIVLSFVPFALLCLVTPVAARTSTPGTSNVWTGIALVALLAMPVGWWLSTLPEHFAARAQYRTDLAAGRPAKRAVYSPSGAATAGFALWAAVTLGLGAGTQQLAERADATGSSLGPASNGDLTLANMAMLGTVVFGMIGLFVLPILAGGAQLWRRRNAERDYEIARAGYEARKRDENDNGGNVTSLGRAAERRQLRESQ